MPEELSRESNLQEVEDLPISNGANKEGRPERVNKVTKSDEVEDLKTIHKPDASKDQHEGMPSTQQEAHEGIQVCRVCQCADAEKAGEAALKSLGICFPAYASPKETTGWVQCCKGGDDKNSTVITQDVSDVIFKNQEEASRLNDSLIELGCACRSDLSLAHYACALRWFLSRESLVCEICGVRASTIRVADRDKVISTLKEIYLQQRPSIQGEGSTRICSTNTVTPLSVADGGASFNEISWFDPHGSLMHNTSDPVIDIPEDRRPPPNSASPAAKWAVEATGILAATGLLTVTINWLIAPRTGKGLARKGVNVLLAGLCALAIVIFLRFGVLPRIKYGPARYWTILVVFWFLIFGVWASSTRTTRASP